MGLNYISEPYKDFRNYHLLYIEQIPLLIAEGRRIITVAQVMERRLFN